MEFKLLFHHFLALWLWASYLPSLGFCLFFHSLPMLIFSTLSDYPAPSPTTYFYILDTTQPCVFVPCQAEGNNKQKMSEMQVRELLRSVRGLA